MNDNEKNVVTLKLRFHKDRDEEYSVYRFLKSSGQSVTKTVISCVDVYRNIQSEHEREERFINRVEEVLIKPESIMLKMPGKSTAKLKRRVENGWWKN